MLNSDRSSQRGARQPSSQGTVAVQDPWWKNAVVYQIYLRSFNDSNGDGVGDIGGVIEKLPYIASLGVDCLWLCPFLKSPGKDFGYDIADYRAVDSLFGDDDDLDALIEQAHQLGLRILVDLAFNHTSDQHAWFRESRRDRSNPKADWYIWADPREDGSPPNNWLSLFGGPAWTFDEHRGQYYCHNFLESQPDLNFYHADVQRELLDIIRYWMRRGFDGCRLDACNFYFHDRRLRDNPANSEQPTRRLHVPDNYNMQRHIYSKTRPENPSFLKQIRATLDAFDGSFSLGEVDDQRDLQIVAEYTASPDLLHSAYTFVQSSRTALPDPDFFRELFQRHDAFPGNGTPAWMFSNHDIVRAASRWCRGDFNHDPRLSQLLIQLLGFFQGVILFYQGDELGLPEVKIPPHRLRDPWGLYLYPKWQGRDGSRVPMPWDAGRREAGFTDADDAWLPIPPVYYHLAVSNQEADPASTLNVARAFLAWRRAQPAIIRGNIAFLDHLPARMLGIRRYTHDQQIIGLYNLSDAPRTVSLADLDGVASIALDPMAIDGVASGVELERDSLRMPAFACAFFRSLQ